MKLKFGLIVLLVFAMTTNIDADGPKKANHDQPGKGAKGPLAGPRGNGGGQAGPSGNGGGRQPGDFDASIFAGTMIQKFDQDGDGALNQGELAACLGMLAQQVQQQNQIVAQTAQQQVINQLAANGQNSLGGHPGQMNCANGEQGAFGGSNGMRGGGGNGGRAGGAAQGGRGGGSGGAGGRGGGR